MFKIIIPQQMNGVSNLCPALAICEWPFRYPGAPSDKFSGSLMQTGWSSRKMEIRLKTGNAT